MLGPRGEGMVRSVLDRRFGRRWSPLELDLISSYLYHISAAPPLGEYSLNSLLEIVTSIALPTAVDDTTTSSTLVKHDHSTSLQVDDKPKLTTFIYAREPLINSLHKLPRTLPVLLLFGDIDWLYNPRDIIHRDVNRLKIGEIDLASSSSKNDAMEFNAFESHNIINEVKLKGGIDITFQVIPDAGHHIYLDNRKGFSHSITQWLKKKKLFD
jgi:pimeloyl-ACP methyl ester carboxylesterase